MLNICMNIFQAMDKLGRITFVRQNIFALVN